MARARQDTELVTSRIGVYADLDELFKQERVLKMFRKAKRLSFDKNSSRVMTPKKVPAPDVSGFSTGSGAD